MMDKLRTAGPWESEQTHDSLRKFLLEETYEVLDAVHSGNADQLREELGDVLLQVLFHARIAEDAPLLPFTIDDVATTLMRKLGNRVPGVLAGQSISLEDQLSQWEERKAAEKSRNSVMDDVHTGQPALALAQKVIERVSKAGAAGRADPGRDHHCLCLGRYRCGKLTAHCGFRVCGHGSWRRRGDCRRRAGATAFQRSSMWRRWAQITAEEWRTHWPSGAVAIR